MMSDVLASSKQDMAQGPSGGGPHSGRNQASAERLDRRMNVYRTLHSNKLPSYDRAMNNANQQQYHETAVLHQRLMNSGKKTKGPKKSNSEKQQSKMAGTVNKDNSSSNNSPANSGAGVNKMNNSQLTMNGLPQYGGGGGIKRPPPEDDKKSLDNCVDPAKRPNLETGIKCESPSSVSEGNFSNHDFGKYSNSNNADNKSDIVGKIEPKEEVLNFKDDSLGDLDGIMNSDTFNDLMSDLNIPNDFIDQFEFNDKNALEDLGNVIGSELGSGAGLDDKDDEFLQQPIDSPPPNMGGASNSGANSRPPQMSGSSSFAGNNDIQQQQQQPGNINPMEANNAAERLKIMAQQHQQHQSTPPVSCGGMGPSGMGPSRMGPGPPMQQQQQQQQGQQPNMYHGNMHQPNQQQHQMPGGPNSLTNGHMMGGMPMSQQQHPRGGDPMHPGMRQGGPPPGSLPNLPTMPLPLPQSMPSPLMTCGSMTTSTSSPAMSNMSAAQMQQQHQQQQQQQQLQQQAQMSNMTHQQHGGGPMQHGMPNGPMGPGPGPGGMHPTMYNNGMMNPAMVERMRAAQGRYRLGTPNPHNMRPGLPMSGAPGQVVPGQNSPIGGGMPQPQVMSNQNMRQQVSTDIFKRLY